MTGKRKRDEESELPPVSIQVVAGSYDRTLLGLVACLTPPQQTCAFSTNFLFNAHASSIRALAISPPSDSHDKKAFPKRLLATGGADEKINIYQISAAASHGLDQPRGSETLNRELGSLLYHSSTVTALSFPSKGKVISASLDNTIAVSKVREMSVLSTIRAPFPKVQGRPSGDTAALGEFPSGINDIAVHPSAKLCLSVGQGEKCMRLWNLMTAKKEGVLTFPKAILAALKESGLRSGEGQHIVFSPDGEEFAVGFERGAIIYGLDCRVRGIATSNNVRVCQLRYGLKGPNGRPILAMSTEDGRVLLFDSSASTALEDTIPSNVADTTEENTGSVSCALLGELGHAQRGRRIKDFSILTTEDSLEAQFVVTGTSSGHVGLWQLPSIASLALANDKKLLKGGQNDENNIAGNKGSSKKEHNPIEGRLLGTFETGKRITCLGAFIMESKPS